MSIRRDPPYSLVDPRRFLSREECEAIAHRVMDAARGGGDTRLRITSEWFGDLRWARNRTTLASDRRRTEVSIMRAIGGARGFVTTNQLDDDALLAAVREAERILREGATTPPDVPDPPARLTYPETHIWSPDTYAQETDYRARTAAAMMDAAEKAGMLAAGQMGVSARGTAFIGSDIGPPLYAAQTLAQCSTTVRDAQGTGSGWAGTSASDWSRIDAPALGRRALQKCLASRNPVGIEPGRYTLIMEPQAVYDFVAPMFHAVPKAFLRRDAEANGAAFFEGVDPEFPSLLRSKLGRKVLDERITIEHDPADPELGVLPFTVTNPRQQEPYRAVKWVDRGVLSNLETDRGYALTRLQQNLGFPDSGAFRMSGGTTSIEEMIRTTRRGLLVTRFWQPYVVDFSSMLMGGSTRDGLWLIENGAISKAVKNLRFTESPLFALNSIEQLGEPQRVYAPGTPAIVPAMKVRDFSFTSLVDAI